MKTLSAIVAKEVYKYTGKRGVKYLRLAWRIPGFKFMLSSRLANRYSKFHPLGIISRYFYKKFFVKYGIQIPRSIKIGDGFLISHFGGIVINKAVVIGNDCTICQNINIGHSKRGKKAGAPVLGDRVYIGPNAVLIGNIKIGNDVLIAPQSFVTIDIPDNAVVAGNPAQIINLNGSKGYIVNLIHE